MASTSTSVVKKLCFNCRKFSSEEFRNVWRMNTGNFVKLCVGCASEYERGVFCERFHEDSDGWRDCRTCGKLIHCGCIASMNHYMFLNFGGVICMRCFRESIAMAPNRSAPSEELFTIAESPFSGAHHEENPVEPIRSEESHASDKSLGTQTDNGISGGFSNRQVQLLPQHRPKAIDQEIQQISRNSNSVVIPLFEKPLSNSDADHKLPRLVIPKRCAEVYFPEISHHRAPIQIYDITGKAWLFHISYWINKKSKMSVLDGLKDYKSVNQWQPGDIVTFYRVEPEGRLVMGLRKNLYPLSPPPPPPPLPQVFMHPLVLLVSVIYPCLLCEAAH